MMTMAIPTGDTASCVVLLIICPEPVEVLVFYSSLITCHPSLFPSGHCHCACPWWRRDGAM